MDFGAPKAGTNTDPGKLGKVAQRVEKILGDNVLFKEAKQLDPKTVLTSPVNRDGAPPNIQHVHKGILKSFKTSGFDRTRPQIGICIKYESEEGKRKLLEHNKRFSKGSSLFPPIDESVALYGSIAGSHLNIAYRCIQSGTRSPVGDLGSLIEGLPSLEDAVKNGHRWWILPETLEQKDFVDISHWRNQYQNENQGVHEIEVLQTVISTAEEMASKSLTSSTKADLVARASRRNPAKMGHQSLSTLTTYYNQFLKSGDVHLVKELVDFHAERINPAELVISNVFFESLVNEEALNEAQVLKHYLVLTQYTNEKTRDQAGRPSTSMFIEPSNLVTLVRKDKQVVQVEKKLRELRDQLLPILEQQLSAKQARIELADYMILIIRCLLAKPWPADNQGIKMGKTRTGQFSVEKIKNLGVLWAKRVDQDFPELSLGLKADLLEEEEEEAEAEEVMDLGQIRSLKRRESESKEPSCKNFKRGDQVTVVRRMTWTFPSPAGSGSKAKKVEEIRKDIPEGLEGTVEGFADPDGHQVLLKVVLTLSSGPREIVHSAYSRNLQLTNEYNLAKAGASGATESENKKDEDKKGGKKRVANCPPKWILGDSDPSTCKLEPHWTKYLADKDETNKVFWLKSRIGVALESLAESLPTYSEKDLFVLFRSNAQGVPKGEVWTKRDFGPHELIFAPLVSMIKDTHLTLQGHAVLGVPKQGLGAHLAHQPLALDGRGKLLLAKAGTLDSNEHKGNLYWCVQRTSTNQDANMTAESVAWEHQVTLSMPFKKKKSTVDWASKDLPTIPILINKNKIAKDTQLLVFYSDKKK